MACPDLLLSQSAQTDISFDNTDKKYLPLEKVYFHILGKLHEALFDLKKWDCSFDKEKGVRNEDVTQPESPSNQTRSTIIRRASRNESISCPEFLTQKTTSTTTPPPPPPPTHLPSTQTTPPRLLQISPFVPQNFFKKSSIEESSSPMDNPLLPLQTTQSASPIQPTTLPQSPSSIVSAFSLQQKCDYTPTISNSLTIRHPLDNMELKKISGGPFEELDCLRVALSKAIQKSEFGADQTTELCNIAASLKSADNILTNNQTLSQDLLRANLLQMSMTQNICPIMSTSRTKSEKKRQKIPANYHMLDDALTTNCAINDVKMEDIDTTDTVTKEKFHQCPYCDAKFNQKSNLKTHVFGVHHFKLSTCRTCKIITSKAKLQEHMKTHPNRGFKCDQCNTSFDTQIRLLRHMKIHSSERPYKCTYCMKSFVYKWNLTEHIRIHTGEKPFVCRLCGKGFCQSSTLKRHSLAMHTTEKPYKCSQCDESFVRILLLKKHFVNKHLNAVTTHSTGLTDLAITDVTTTTTSNDALSMLHMLGRNI